MDVVAPAWRAAGRPLVAATIESDQVCAGCGAAPGAIPAKKVVSSDFTGYDAWIFPHSLNLCPACAWAYRTPELRRTNYLVELRQPLLRAQSRADVVALLQAGPLAGHCSLTVPLRPGRRHLLPLARWGCVTTDHATIAWSAGDAHRLVTVLQLRRHGFGSAALAAPAPAYATLTKIPRTQWAVIAELWQLLAPWRSRDNPWLDLACHLTTPTKKATE